MVEVKIDYLGGLRCAAHHGPSGQELRTDAPLDNNGRGELFSPTDLLATALGTCMETIMGIAAARKGVELEGLRIVVKKHMSEDQPRRVDTLEVDIFMPIAEDHPEKKLLQSVALSCPVHHSLHPDIKIPITWLWTNSLESLVEKEAAIGSKELHTNAAENPNNGNHGSEVANDLEIPKETQKREESQEESPLAWLRRASEQTGN